MKLISCEKLEKSMVELQFSIDAETFKSAVNAAFNREGKKYAIPGFRKGKVPKKVLESAYGAGVFYEEAINIAFPKYYEEVLDKEPSIEAVARPDIDIKDISEKGISMIAEVAVKPEVKLGDYKGIKIEKVEYNVKDDDIATEVNRLLEQHAA